ncbi:hypothetical protein [Rhodococcus qingshengii]|nr:hypothetical protein [Rhodococcus qingshengii]
MSEQTRTTLMVAGLVEGAMGRALTDEENEILRTAVESSTDRSPRP